MCFSKTLLRLHSTEIGLKLFRSDLLPNLWMSETLPIFHVDGKVPVAILRLSNLVMVLDKTGAESHRSLAETPSRPVALFSSRLASSFVMLSSVIRGILNFSLGSILDWMKFLNVSSQGVSLPEGTYLSTIIVKKFIKTVCNILRIS